MDATNSHARSRHHERRGRRHRQRRHNQQPHSNVPEQPSNSVPFHEREFVENKMGLPPPYEQSVPNPAPPPSYFGNNPPPPAGFVAPEAPPRTTVITSPQAPAGPPGKLGPGPTGTTCQTCNKTVVTRVDYVPNNRTHIISAALCILAGCCCGCFVPYCMRSCKTANHYCPQCKAFVGAFTPS
ncbi:lipopolysaccharide-induced tumor necrosis factor-alpha factor homolog isoform X1 [Bombyx mandarina]|nr:lipopolysaccharide-induced tumor necrosis factor-alpha factor homolog isoform X1 [Bombyx mandarina]